MKSLLEVQQDIRNLELKLKSISEDVRGVYADIDDIRNSEQDTGIDYAALEILSKNIPFSKHPIEKLKDSWLRQIYIELLLNIVFLDDEKKNVLQWTKMDIVRFAQKNVNGISTKTEIIYYKKFWKKKK